MIHLQTPTLARTVQGVRLDPPCEEDPMLSFPATARRWGKGECDLRLLGLHAALAANEVWEVADGMQDSQREPTAGDQRRHRVVPKSPARPDQGTARRSRAQADRALQLLRRERQHGIAATITRSGDTCLADVVEPPKSASANDVEAVQATARSSPTSEAHDPSTDLVLTARRPDRRAGWWKSPCPELGRAPAGDRRGYSTSKAGGGRSGNRRGPWLVSST